MHNCSFAPSTGPSAWVERHSPLIPLSGPILDVAAGRGRHTRYLLEKGHSVIAVDKNISYLRNIKTPRLSLIQVDLETDGSWPFKKSMFAGVVVTNYLYRPLFGTIIESLAQGGFLIYETFARGNEEFGKPNNPDYLLEPGELIRATLNKLHIIAYEDLTVTQPKPARVQRICGCRDLI
jgi:SAM-dependent methyltransferase